MEKNTADVTIATLTTSALDSDLRQKSLFSLLVEMIQFWAAQKPLAILIENAQWMDDCVWWYEKRFERPRRDFRHGRGTPGTGISVLVVCPVIINTAIVHVSPTGSGMTAAQIQKLQRYYADEGCEPSVVAADVVRAVESDASLLFTGPGARLGFNARRVRVNGLELNVIIEGEGPDVLLVHGFPDDHAVWRKQIPALVAAGYRVIAPDTRGCGDSDVPSRVKDYRVAFWSRTSSGCSTSLGSRRSASSHMTGVRSRPGNSPSGTRNVSSGT